MVVNVVNVVIVIGVISVISVSLLLSLCYFLQLALPLSIRLSALLDVVTQRQPDKHRREN